MVSVAQIRDRETKEAVAVCLNELVSVLSRLKASRVSDIARKRIVEESCSKGKRGCRGATAAEPKNITAGYPYCPTNKW